MHVPRLAFLRSPFLPEIPREMFEAAEAAQERDPEMRPFQSEVEHPLYQSRPVHTFTGFASMPRGKQMEHAKAIEKQLIKRGLEILLR